MTAIAEQSAPTFCINSDSTADWLLKQVAAYDAEEKLLKEQHEAAIKRVHSDKESLLHLYREQLESYIAQKIAEDKRGRKSVILPHGTCALRTVPARLKLTDMQQAMEWAKQAAMPDMFKTVEAFDAERYQQAAQCALETQGAILPGVEVLPARESFSIKFGAKE